MKKNKTCEICENRGYIRVKNEEFVKLCKCIKAQCQCDGEEPYFISKDNAFEKCKCHNYRRTIDFIKHNFKNSGVPKKYNKKFFEDLSHINKITNKIIPGIKHLLANVENIITNYPDNKKRRGIVFWSETTGNGKTLSACVIMNTLMFEYGVTGKLLKLSSDYFGRLKKSYSSYSFQNEQNIIESLLEYQILLIDDFGTHRGTKWEQEKLYELIDGRNDSEKLTLITTNLNLSDIKKQAEHDRVLSRVIEMCDICHVKTPNYRNQFLRET